MKSRAVLAVALGVVAFGLVPIADATPVPGPDGQKCFLLSATDLTPEPPDAFQVGILVAGPLEGAGVLTCSVHVGNSTHAGARSAFMSATDDVVPGRIVGAQIVSFPSPPLTPVYVCARYTEGSSTIYWTGDHWDNNVNSTCEQTVVVATSDPIVGTVLDPAVSLLTPLVCPVLQLLAPLFSDPNSGLLYIHPTGDTFLFRHPLWDCPPLDRLTVLEFAQVIVGPLP